MSSAGVLCGLGKGVGVYLLVVFLLVAHVTHQICRIDFAIPIINLVGVKGDAKSRDELTNDDGSCGNRCKWKIENCKYTFCHKRPEMVELDYAMNYIGTWGSCALDCSWDEYCRNGSCRKIWVSVW